MTRQRARPKRPVAPPPPFVTPVQRASPKRLRHLVFLVILAALGFWAGGGAVMATLSRFWPGGELPEELSVHITPPAYTDRPDIVLAAPDGGLAARSTVDVPEGSIVTVKMLEKGTAPVLKVGSRAIPLVSDGIDHFTASETITGGGSITLKRGWRTLDSWHIRLIRDLPPNVRFVETPLTVRSTSTRISYEVSDDYGVESVVALIGPALSGPASLEIRPVRVPLALHGARHALETDIQDLTFLPWAGSQVDVQLEARDGGGNTAESKKITMTLPKRAFSHPLARALIEEREKLLHQDSDVTRDEAANIMAGIARTMAGDNGDPVVFMALRTGAVRLVLDEKREALPAVTRLMWQAAARIEDTMKSTDTPPLLHAGGEKNKG